MTFFDEEEIAAQVFDGAQGVSEVGRTIEVLAARSTVDELAAVSQGGGTVSALVITALQEGIIDAAIVTDRTASDGFPRGIVATTAAEVAACAGSRFMGSHTLAALKEAFEAGYRKIGVVGVPCQVRAVRKMALYDLQGEGFRERIALTIGLFCNWAFSAGAFTEALRDRLSGKDVKKIDIPPPPANRLDIVTSEGVESIPLDDLRHLIQGACAICPDMTSEYSDVSVGMFEGRAGWNTVIVRTAAGREIVARAVASGSLGIEPFPQSNLDHLKQASARKRLRASSGGS